MFNWYFKIFFYKLYLRYILLYNFYFYSNTSCVLKTLQHLKTTFLFSADYVLLRGDTNRPFSYAVRHAHFAPFKIYEIIELYVTYS